MRYLSWALLGLLSLIPQGCSSVYRPIGYLTSQTSNQDHTVTEKYEDDFDGDGKIDSVITSTISDPMRIDEVDANNDGKVDIRCIIRYLEDGRMRIRFDGDGDGAFEDDFYFTPQDEDDIVNDI